MEPVEGNSDSDLTKSSAAGVDFIRCIINQDLESDKHQGRVATRFPPEPNGYLHIGHAKSICLNFGIAKQYGGTCNLRFDDTNPCKEDQRFVDAIMADIRWLGFDWDDRLFHASDYFEQMYQAALDLIRQGKAYVCSLSSDEVRQYRGTPTEAGTNSPFRDRTVEENLDLFQRMRAGEFEDGAHILRAKIDMASPNLNMRDPAIYRIRHADHQRTGDSWCIYPMYDFCHCLSDSLEGITHSICTLEFEAHRPLYDWFLDELGWSCHPQQIEFARLNLNYTVMSKRKLLRLVEGGYVDGWDDPRMPTLAGMRRRGYTPEAIRDLCDRIGVAKAHSTVDIGLLDYCLREDLNKRAERRMVVLNPLKLVIDNYPEGQVEELEAENNPEDPETGSRRIPFSRELWIEKDDFREVAPKKWHRLSPGMEVRLKHAYYVTCTDVVKDADGEVIELRCQYDPATKGGWSDDGRKVKGTLHWVSAPHAKQVEVRLFEHLFQSEFPEDATQGVDFTEDMNPGSIQVFDKSMMEPSLADANAEDRYQFLRHGYFVLDSRLSTPEHPIFLRTVGLRDSWAKLEKKLGE